jgi:hypothetical protein
VINFDSLADLTSVTTQFSGLTFGNTTVLTAGFSLNEFEFPPLSGMNVVFDDGGRMGIVFDTLQASVGGYFTYGTALTFTAYTAGGSVVGTDTSDFLSNLALSGDPGTLPNEFLGITSSDGIQRITIEGDFFGGSFTLDNLTFEAAAAPVPEPSIPLLLGSGLAHRHGRREPSHVRERGEQYDDYGDLPSSRSRFVRCHVDKRLRLCDSHCRVQDYRPEHCPHRPAWRAL